MGGSGDDDEDEAAARSLFKTNNIGVGGGMGIGGPAYLASRPFQIHPTTQGGEFIGQDDIRAEQELDLYNK